MKRLFNDPEPCESIGRASEPDFVLRGLHQQIYRRHATPSLERQPRQRSRPEPKTIVRVEKETFICRAIARLDVVYWSSMGVVLVFAEPTTAGC